MKDLISLRAGRLDPGFPRIKLAEREILRSLASRVAELATLPIQEEKRTLWSRHNALKPTRPLFFCDPENGWTEIIEPDLLECVSDLGRAWEMTLRKELFWGESMGDDRVTEAHFSIPTIYEETDWGVCEKFVQGDAKGSYIWEPALKTYDDFDKLHFPEITIDRDATEALISLAEETLGDLLPIKIRNLWHWSLGPTWMLVKMRGLEQMMLDMFLHPCELHRLLGFLRDAYLARLDFLEQNNLFSLNNDDSYVGSGGFGYTTELPQTNRDNITVHPQDLWGFTESQETVGWSPAQFEEFVFPYQEPLLARFGLNCYGCCEPLDNRWSIVKRLPRLRRVSVSPWANVEFMANELQDNYIFSMKPNPTMLALPDINEEEIRKNTRHILDVTRGCRLEIIMKDNNTIGKNPNNVIRWCRIVREEIEAAC